jgi:hypothetical protein
VHLLLLDGLQLIVIATAAAVIVVFVAFLLGYLHELLKMLVYQFSGEVATNQRLKLDDRLDRLFVNHNCLLGVSIFTLVPVFLFVLLLFFLAIICVIFGLCCHAVLRCLVVGDLLIELLLVAVSLCVMILVEAGR